MKQAATAAAVYRKDIEPTLDARQRFVRAYLQEYIELHREAPTGQELVRFIRMKCPHQLIDVNTVRPRCTEMEELGMVKHGNKRRCRISGKTVYTWELSTPRPPSSEPTPRRLEF